MALGVDRALSDTSSQMEHSSYGRWKSRIPGIIRSGHTRPLTAKTDERLKLGHGQGTKDSDRESSASKKSVTMAPMSRYMTGRSLYTVRKPLITAEHNISILKNPLTQDYTDNVHVSSVKKYQKEREDSLSKHSNKCTPESTSIPQVIASSLSGSREDLDDSLSMSDLRLCSSYEEADFSSVPLACQYEKCSVSRQPLDDLRLTVPLSPKWTSSQGIFPSPQSPQSRFLQNRKTRAFEQDGESPPNTRSLLSSSKGHSSDLRHMSPYQANYWACAIPNFLPPSPDRKSSSWDPDQEYQALLDYTYPIRPNMTSALGSNESRLLQSDLHLLDSGIDLDNFCSSSSVSCLEQSGTGTRLAKGGPFFGRKSSEFQSLNVQELSHSKSSDSRLSSSLYSSLDQVGVSVESLNCERKQNFHYKKFGIFSTSRSAPNFIRSTNVLARPSSIDEWDEEFLRLPEQLQELHELSQQLRDITLQISQPVTTSWESLERESTSVRSSAAHVDKKAAEVSAVQEEESEDKTDCKNPPLNEMLSEQVQGLGATVEMISNKKNKSSLSEVEAISEKLSKTYMSEFQRRTGTDQGEEETKDSLLQHIQVFCSNLQDLIQWLYMVVEKMQVLSPPSVNIESVKASLADYKSFQRDVQAHQPLTTSVLQTGEILLSSMNSASPFLKETLMLIERQSRALESHSEHLFSSILSAMDRLTESSTQQDIESTS